MSNLTPADEKLLSLATVIDSRVGSMFIVDYGTVKAVNGSKVDVEHAVKGVLLTGEVLPPYITKDVELLYPSGAKFSMGFPASVGDGVLLVGLKDYVKSVSGAIPIEPKAFRHYSRETLKAIPLSVFNGDATAVFKSNEAGLFTMKNTSTSLKIILSDITQELTTFATGLNPTTLPAQAAALVAALVLITTKISQLLEE